MKTILICLVTMFVLVSSTFVRGNVINPSMNTPPDGFIKVAVKNNDYFRNNKGMFEFGYYGSGGKVNWVSPEKLIQHDINRTDVKYIGMGYDNSGDVIILFYKLGPF